MNFACEAMADIQTYTQQGLLGYSGVTHITKRYS